MEKRCEHKYRIVIYRHCEDCGADAPDARKKCVYCGGKIVKERYEVCKQCGVVK